MHKVIYLYSFNQVIFINTVIAPGKARSNNFYNENSLFTLCTVLTLTLESHEYASAKKVYLLCRAVVGS